MGAARMPSAARLTLIMCAAESLSMTGFAAFTTLLPTLVREWGITNTEAGAIGGIFYAGYMVAVPVLTSLTDRVDSRRVYAAACLLSSLGAAGFALFASGLWSALMFQFLIGAALGGTYMPGLKALTDHIEGRAQSRAVAFYTAAFGLGSSISILVCGKIGALYGWQWAFAFGAVGPVLAAALVLLAVPHGRVRPATAPKTALLDFRPVFRNRRTVPYIIGYALHNYELFGQRSWMVAFLVFCAALQPAEAPMLLSAATLAAIINLLGPVFSVSGNELAIRFGRARIIFFFMTLSGLIACFVGFTAAWPWYFVVALMCLHYATMLGDSGALTSGAVASTPPELRGAMMAVYSFLGFSTAFLAPFVFGLTLDLAGGSSSQLAWGLAFASIGIFGALAPLARWLYNRRQAA
jgi:MFS family permease